MTTTRVIVLHSGLPWLSGYDVLRKIERGGMGVGYEAREEGAGSSRYLRALGVLSGVFCPAREHAISTSVV